MGRFINILSWLLIDSELKGNIESPADYFTDIPELYLPTIKIVADVPVELYQQQYFNELAMRDFILKSGSILLDEVKVIEYLQTRDIGLVGGAISFIGGSGVMCLLDGNPVPKEVLMNIPMSDIDVVDLLKHYSIGEIAIFGTRGAGGIVSVFTKKGGGEYYDPYTPGTIAEKIVGYSSYREFYSPKYTPGNIDSEKPDHRITLYWNPDIITENGKASISFFTSDDISRYKIFVEGITQIGEICLGISEFVVSKDHVDLEK